MLMKPQAFDVARWRHFVLSGLCAAIVTVPVLAQTATPSSDSAAPRADDEVITLPQFTVSGEAADRYRAADAVSAVRVRAPLLETPSTITVLTRDMIDDLAPSRLFDVTRYAAGVQEGRGIQFQDRMILRGFESNGQRVVDNFLQPDDADNITEVVIDRLEISKGPNAILSPAGGPGGAVNVITKSPLYRRQRSVTGVIGLFDAQKLTLDMTDAFSPGSKAAYRFIGSIQDTRRYWSDDARMRNKALAPMFTYKISDRTQLTVKLIGSTQWIFREPLLIIDPRVGPQTDDPYLAPGLSKKGRNGIQPWSHTAVDTADLFALLTTSFNENISLRVAANGRYYFTDSVQEFITLPGLNNTRYQPLTGEFTQDYVWSMVNGQPVSTFSPLFQPGNIPVRGDAQWTRLRYANLQSDLAARYNFPGVTTQTVGGVAVSRRLSVNKVKSGTLPGIDLSRPYVAATPIWDSNLYANNVGNFTNWQAYVNERLGFLDDRVQATGGILHYDTYTYARNAINATNAPSILDDAKNVWMASLLVKVQPNASVYYSHSTNSSPVIANNQPLWRDGVQDEVGFKTEWFNQRLAFNAAYFEISQTNVTTPNPERQTNPSAPEQIVQDLNNHGYEFELTGGITNNLSVLAAYSQLKMRDSLGRHVRAVADRNASILLNYRFTEGAPKGLSLSLGVSYSGRRAGDAPPAYTIASVPAKTSFFLKPYYVTNFSASYTWHDYVFRLYVDNVLDDSGYIQQAGGRVSGTGITTAPGMNVKFSTTWNF
ncbi:TonB-dependent receptor [Opitutus terrae]|uniref:TonB-dependent receptor plug n=1 Tax=Opitutus terrae (strain DSM 11246 / JCM 15787 / PB90-1) TaxID=452637 RepID=B1ZXK3_OPITP|nr:TonB-dependent receptor plug domain-containing protein [Opitutus terrae]ACB76998.1 TonB-dependent receptor plug [Opitutus terrae PB90-1]